jgi:hypothetical protein
VKERSPATTPIANARTRIEVFIDRRAAVIVKNTESAENLLGSGRRIDDHS